MAAAELQAKNKHEQNWFCYVQTGFRDMISTNFLSRRRIDWDIPCG